MATYHVIIYTYTKKGNIFMERKELFEGINQIESLIKQVDAKISEIDSSGLMVFKKHNDLLFKIKEYIGFINESISKAYSSLLINQEEYLRARNKLKKIYEEYCCLKIESFNKLSFIPSVQYFPYNVDTEIDISSVHGDRVVLTFPKAVFKITGYSYHPYKTPMITDKKNRISTIVLPNVRMIDYYKFNCYPRLEKVEAPNLEYLYGESFENVKSNKKVLVCKFMTNRLLRDSLINAYKKEGLEVNYHEIELKLAIINNRAQKCRHEAFIESLKKSKRKRHIIKYNKI